VYSIDTLLNASSNTK
jgi:translation initiation factor 3 subunit I